MGIWGYVIAFGPNTTFLSLLPALILHGIGIGFATSQLQNVVLSDIPPQKAGSASGASGMVRQVGTALGIALIGAIFVSQASGNIKHNVDKAEGLPAPVKQEIIARASAGIGGGSRTSGASPAVLELISDGIADAAKPATAFAGTVVVIGALISLLVPNIPPDSWPSSGGDADTTEAERSGDEDDELEPA